MLASVPLAGTPLVWDTSRKPKRSIHLKDQKMDGLIGSAPVDPRWTCPRKRRYARSSWRSTCGRRPRQRRHVIASRWRRALGRACSRRLRGARQGAPARTLGARLWAGSERFCSTCARPGRGLARRGVRPQILQRAQVRLTNGPSILRVGDDRLGATKSCQTSFLAT
jgi:hypothetical protein